MMLATVLLAMAGRSVAGDLRGHGGPVRAILVQGTQAVTGSFDTTLIRWDLARGVAQSVLRFHEGAVNALTPLPGGGFASAGEDRRIALWNAASTAPIRVLEGHDGAILALALSPDGKLLASAGRDGTIRFWPLADGEARVIDGRHGPVNALAFLPDGRLASAAYDGTFRLHPSGGGEAASLALGLPLNALLIADGEIVIGGADGVLRIIDPATMGVTVIEVAQAPLVALAISPDGQMIATAGFRGALLLVDRRTRKVIRRLEGPAFPLWSLAFSSDGAEILTGGADRLVRRWRVATGEPVSPIAAEPEEARWGALANHPGVEVYRACIACHTLGPEDGNRAGPSLHRIMGRKIATAPGYAYSPALKGMDIVWTRETIARLFEIGPMAYTPGTKMPEQLVGDPKAREDLVDFIDKATR